MVISANDVKKSGASIFGKILEKVDEVIINVRGKDKYVVLDIERYRNLRALELDKAYLDSLKDIEQNKFIDLDSSEKIHSYFEKMNNELHD